jgi:hypothetical protein
MRPLSLLGMTFVVGLAFVAGGCGSSDTRAVQGESRADEAGAGDRHEPTREAGADRNTGDTSTPVREAGARDASRSEPPLGPPTELAGGPVAVSGLTSDGWVVYRAADALKAVKLPPNSETRDVTARPGNLLIRGRVVFNWVNVDWKKNVGDLSVWTADAGTHEIGTTQYAEGLVAASQQGKTVVYTANTTATTMDLMIAPADLSKPKVLISRMGRGSATTCGPSIGFVGERLFVGWCSAGSRTGKIQRFEETAGQWKATLIADDALPAWSGDASGDRIFYQSSAYAGRYAEAGKTYPIDAGVGGGFLIPSGSVAIYTVGDQLRRTAIPDVKPVTVITRGYAQAAEFTRNSDVVLYSSKVTYDNGTRRDLYIAHTNHFNPDPIELVADPVAGLARSALTKDGQSVLYLTDMTPSGATLHVRSIDGGERMIVPNVADVVAAHEGRIVFTDNSSDPNQYPVVSDLKTIDLAAGEAPSLVEAKIAEGRNFQLDASGKQVIYVRSGIDRDGGGPAQGGLFVRTIP